jgi:predicted Rossmann fold flavoprotein
VTGGGACNFSNLNVSPDKYQSENINFCRSALAGYSTSDFLELMKRYKLAWEERENGELFAFSAPAIADMLISECRSNGTAIKTNITIKSIDKDDDLFTVTTETGVFQGENLIIATGGKSIPKLGATEFGMRIAKQFGHTLVHARPALTSITLPGGFCAELAGITLMVDVTLKRTTIRRNLLFTHHGLTGPAAFWISLYAQDMHDISIDLAPNNREDIVHLAAGGRSILNATSLVVPKALARVILDDLEINSDDKVATATKETRKAIHDMIHSFRIPQGAKADGFDKAEVTAGGVSTKDINSSTMESKLVKGLYFVGEVLDMTGQLGGYNLHWAWASGVKAAESINQYSTTL